MKSSFHQTFDRINSILPNSSTLFTPFGIYGIDVVTTSLSTKVKGNTISGGGKARIHVLAATNSNYRLFTTPKISKVSVSKRKIRDQQIFLLPNKTQKEL